MANILIAEDDESMRNFLARAITRAGHNVISVGTGAAALPYLAEGSFDLLLTDIVMPEMDGIELARRAGELAPDMQVWFITGFAAVALNRRKETPKDAKVLSKPFHLKDVVDQINQVFAA